MQGLLPSEGGHHDEDVKSLDVLGALLLSIGAWVSIHDRMKPRLDVPQILVLGCRSHRPDGPGRDVLAMLLLSRDGLVLPVGDAKVAATRRGLPRMGAKDAHERPIAVREDHLDGCGGVSHHDAVVGRDVP